MKTYIVYDPSGNERGYVRCSGHNAAERMVVEKYGQGASVAYTELGPQFDHLHKGFFTDADAK